MKRRRIAAAVAGGVLLASAGAFLWSERSGAPPIAEEHEPLLSATLHRRIPLGSGSPHELAFSPDGSHLAATLANGEIRLFDTAAGGPPRTLVNPAGATSVAFSPDGKLIAVGGYDGRVRIWRGADGALIHTLGRHDGTVWTIAFAPDGRHVASGGEDRTARIWSLAGGAPKVLRGHELNIWSIRFSPDGRTLATGSFDRTVRLWDAATGRALRIFAGHAQAVVGVAFSPDERLLASGSDDSTVRLWRVADGTEALRLQARSHVYEVAFSRDGRFVGGSGRARGFLGTMWHGATGLGGAGEAARIWRVSDGAPVEALEHPDDAVSLSFSPDGRWLATAGEGPLLSLWRLEEPR
jgi:WD40 repeat protein